MMPSIPIIGRENHAPVIHSFSGVERMETLPGRTQRKSIIKATLEILGEVACWVY